MILLVKIRNNFTRHQLITHRNIFFLFFVFMYKAQLSTNSIYNADVITLHCLHNHSSYINYLPCGLLIQKIQLLNYLQYGLLTLLTIQYLHYLLNIQLLTITYTIY